MTLIQVSFVLCMIVRKDYELCLRLKSNWEDYSDPVSSS